MVNNHYRHVAKGKEASVHFQPVISWNTSNQQGTKVPMKDFQGVYKLERLQQGTKEDETQYNQGTKGAGSEDQFGASQQLLNDINGDGDGVHHVHKSVDVDNGQKCSCLQWIYVSISIYIYIVDVAGSGDTKNDCDNETVMMRVVISVLIAVMMMMMMVMEMGQVTNQDLALWEAPSRNLIICKLMF